MKTSLNAPRGLLTRWLAVLLALVVMLAGCSHSDSPSGAPSITGQPVDVSAVVGASATLSVQASGTGLAFQWQASTDGGTTWVDVAGATASSYSTPAVTLADNGKRFRVMVSGAAGSVPSSAVTLTVTAAVVAPTITVAPAAASVVAPAAATFSVTASGTGLAFQWQLSIDGGATWNAISGAQSASYDAGATGAAMNGRMYRVVVTNSAGSVTSPSALLTVAPAPAAPQFTLQPLDQSVIAGTAAVFSATVTGTPNPTLQWQRSTDAGATWTNVAGAVAASYDTGITTVAQDGQRYRVVAVNSAGTVASSAARLSVGPAPQAPIIVTQPADQSVSAPATATFTAGATGVPTPAWQWQLSTNSGVNWANVNGATTASYTTPPTVASDNGRRYRAIASNTAGSATTASALLTVNSSGGWQGAPALLESVADAADANIGRAFDSSGRVIAAWSQFDGVHKVYANTYSPGAGWAGRVAVSTHSDPLQSAFFPEVAADTAGNAIVIWEHRNDGGTGSRNVMASRLSGGVWSPPVPLSALSLQGNEIYGHRLAMDSLGNAVAIWYQKISLFSPWQLFAAHYVPGPGWSVASRIDSDAMGGDFGDIPQLAMSVGRAMVVTGGGAVPGGGMLWAIGMAADGTWESPVFLDDAGNNRMQPRIAMLPTGEAMAVWNRMDNPSYRSIWSARYVAGSGWGAPVAVETDNAGNTRDPQLEYEQQTGSTVAAWVQFDGTVDRLMTNRYVAGTGWGIPQSIDAGGSFNAPSLAVDAAHSHAVIAWGRSFQTWAVRFTPGTGWGAAQAAPSPGADGVNYSAGNGPVSAIDGNGDATVIWPGVQGGLSGYSIYAGRFK